MKCIPLRIFCAALGLSGFWLFVGVYLGIGFSESQSAKARGREMLKIQENHALKVKLQEAQYPVWTKKRGK